MAHYCGHLSAILLHSRAGASPASRDRGGGGGKIKIRGQSFLPKCKGLFWPKSQIFRPKAGDPPQKKGLRRNPKSQIFRPKAGDLQKKKKVFAKIRGLFLAEIANFNVFSAQKHQLLPPKKIPWGQEKNRKGGQKRKLGGHCPPWPPLATRLQPCENKKSLSRKQRWALRKKVCKFRNLRCALCLFFRSCAISVALYACFFRACAICVALYAFFFSACAICVCESVNLIFVAL